MSLSKDVARIRGKLGFGTVEWQAKYWLDTGNPDLNATLAHREKGLEYGRLYEIAGWESQGKTAVLLALAALAQAQGSLVIWVDAENSFDEVWASKRGLDPKEMVLIKPRLKKKAKASADEEDIDTKKKSSAKSIITSAEDMCDEAEAMMEELGHKYKGIFIAVDSIPTLLTEKEGATVMSKRNMRTNMELPMFLSSTMRRWLGKFQVNHAMGVFINQLRNRPDPFDPIYTPGGNATRFAFHGRARIARSQGKVIKRKGKTVGIQGIMTNYKNKSGTPERERVGFKLYFDGPIQFLPADELTKDHA